jgi:hypothetical protein
MSTIPTSKFGDCSVCPAKNTNVIKRGKDLFCLNCARKSKVKAQIEKANERNKLRSLVQGNGNKEMAEKNNAGLDLWFAQRRKEMTGKCLFCNGKTEKYNDSTFKRSIAHLLAKRGNMFPSVAQNPDNWLELCFYGNSCHTNLDNGMITWEFLRDSKEWDVIVTKFKKIYPFIALNERGRIPEILLKELDGQT